MTTKGNADETLERLEVRVKEIWAALGKAVTEHDVEAIDAGTLALEGISLDHALSLRLRAADITQRTLTWLRGAYPEEGFPQFHRDLDRAESGLKDAIEARDSQRLDWWLRECWETPMPLRTQDQRVTRTHLSHTADDILGLSPQVKRMIEEHPTQPDEPEG